MSHFPDGNGGTRVGTPFLRIIVDEARYTAPNHKRPPRDQSSSQSVFEKQETPQSPSSASEGPPVRLVMGFLRTPINFNTRQLATPHTTPPSHAVVLKEVDAPIVSYTGER